jgi:hypothetical protein
MKLSISWIKQLFTETITWVERYKLGLFLWSFYSSFHYILFIDIKIWKIYGIISVQDTSLSHAYNDILRGAHQFIPKWPLNFNVSTHKFFNCSYMKLYLDFLKMDFLHYWSGIFGLYFGSEWIHVCLNKHVESYNIYR